MNTTIFAAVIEDDKGEHHQFHAVSEDALYEELAAWVRPRWECPRDKQPEDDIEAVNLYFEEQATEAPRGFQHELWVLDPIELGSPDLNCSPFAVADTAFIDELKARYGQACPTYPIEIIVNGGLELKFDSEDAEGDMRAIRALMTWRSAKRQNRPLTDTELYGKENPHEIVHTSPHGKLRVLDGLDPTLANVGKLQVMAGYDPAFPGELPHEPMFVPGSLPRPFLTEPKEIDDAIDAWQATGSETGPLHAWLGWSREQYASWVETSVVPSPEGTGQAAEEGQS